MTSGVYGIKNLADDRIYVGSSGDIRLRWYTLRYELDRGKCKMPALQQAWAACAGEGFTFLILETSVGPKEVRRAREQWWIDHFGEATYNLRRAIKPTPIRKEAPALAPDCHPLTRRRKALGLSMAELADLAGISHVTIWRLETSGKRPTLVVERALEATLSRMERDAVESSKCAG